MLDLWLHVTWRVCAEFQLDLLFLTLCNQVTISRMLYFRLGKLVTGIYGDLCRICYVYLIKLCLHCRLLEVYLFFVSLLEVFTSQKVRIYCIHVEWLIKSVNVEWIQNSKPICCMTANNKYISPWKGYHLLYIKHVTWMHKHHTQSTPLDHFWTALCMHHSYYCSPV